MFMNKKELDFTHFSPEVFQAVAGKIIQFMLI